MLYPARRVRDGADDPGRRSRRSTSCRRTRYRDNAALVGETSDNLPGVPGRGGEDRREVDQAVRRPGRLVARVDKIKGKAGESLRAHLADVMRNHQLNELVGDLELPLRARRHALARAGTARPCTRSSTRWSSGCCATGCTVPRRGRARGRGRLRPGRQVLGAGALGRLAGRARRPGGRSASPSPAVRARHRRADRARAGHRRRAAAWFDPTELDAGRRAAVAAWLADPRAAQGAARRQAGPAGARGPRLGAGGVARDTALAAYLARPDQRSYDLADLALRYLHRELRADTPETASSPSTGSATRASPSRT